MEEESDRRGVVAAGSMQHYRFITRILRNGLIEERTLGGMDYLEKLMIFRFTLHDTTILSKWFISQKLFFKSSLLLNGSCSLQVRPLNSSDDLCLLFCPNLRLWVKSFYSRTEDICQPLRILQKKVFNVCGYIFRCPPARSPWPTT